MKIIEGDFATPKGKFAIVAGRFNGFVVEALVAGARDALVRHGVKDDAIELIRVPGAWEIALAAHKLANSGKYTAVIALGAVIREVRNAREVTQQDTAQAAGITVAHLSKIERGLTNPTWGTVKAITHALGVTIAEIAEREEGS